MAAYLWSSGGQHNAELFGRGEYTSLTGPGHEIGDLYAMSGLDLTARQRSCPVFGPVCMVQCLTAMLLQPVRCSNLQLADT